MFQKLIYIFLFFLTLDICILSCDNKSLICDGKMLSVDFASANQLPFPIFGLFDKEPMQSHFDSLTFQNTCFLEISNCVKNQTSPIFLQQAIARKIAGPKVNLKDTITAIDFFTVRNYNTNYLAGSNINNLLKHNTVHVSNWVDNSILHEQLITQLQAKSKLIFGVNTLGFNSRLIEKPTNSGDTCQLAIAITLSNHQIIRDTTVPICIKY